MTTRRTRRTSTSDPATAYAEAVLSGDILTNRWVRLACERHIRDLSRRDVTWNLAAASRAINFFPDVLRLNGGGFEGVPFQLLPFQAFIIGSLFGWHRRDGRRRFQTAYLEIGKGNGKSPLAAGVGLYMLTADGEARAEVYAAASKKDQAAILFRDAVAMVDQSPHLSRRIVKSGAAPTWNLAYQGSFFRPISSDKGQSGPRPHCGLMDEIHEHDSDLVLNMMRAGIKNRRNPLIFEITNSGFDRTTICWQHHEHSIKVLQGIVKDDQWFAFVCGVDDEEKDADGKVIRKADDPLNDPSCWVKANPGLGSIIQEDYLESRVRDAKNIPSERNNVLRLNFCVWTDSNTVYIEDVFWMACSQGRVDPEELRGQSCVAGLDLSSTTDFTSCAYLFDSVPEPWPVYWQIWIPAMRLELRKLRPEQKSIVEYWVKEGWIKPTSGNVIDYDVVESDIVEMASRFDLRELGYDPHNATGTVTRLQNAGITMVPVRQGMLTMNSPTKDLQVRVAKRQINNGGNPVARWALSCMTVASDAAGNLKPDKDRSTDRIDPIVALIIALERSARRGEGGGPSKYEREGVFVV